MPEIVWRGNEACVRSYLRGLFQCDGTVNISGRDSSDCTMRLASSHPVAAQGRPQLLANFGIFARIKKRRAAGERLLPDGKGGSKSSACKADYE